MENNYGIEVANKYALFLNDDEDPLDILKLEENRAAAKKSGDKTKKSVEAKEAKTAKNKLNKATAATTTAVAAAGPPAAAAAAVSEPKKPSTAAPTAPSPRKDSGKWVEDRHWRPCDKDVPGKWVWACLESAY